MKTIKVTKKLLDANPLLKEIGATEGMEMQYEFVSSSKRANESTANTEGDESGGNEGDGEGGGNGSNNPGKKPPFTP
jgi:hypothetical protein